MDMNKYELKSERGMINLHTKTVNEVFIFYLFLSFF